MWIIHQHAEGKLIQRGTGPSFMKKRAGFVHSINKLIISHVFLCEGDNFFLQQPALAKTDYKRNVFKTKLQPTTNNDLFPLFRVKSWLAVYFVPSVQLKRCWWSSSNANARCSMGKSDFSCSCKVLATNISICNEKKKLKAYDLNLPPKSLRAYVIIRSGENICHFPSFVLNSLSKRAFICCK